MNVGVCLDEGFASESDEFILYYAERTQRGNCCMHNIRFEFVHSHRNLSRLVAVEISCPGNAGHASLLNKNTAAEKIQYIINRFMNFREYECQRLQNNPKLTFGDVTSVNLTMLQVVEYFFFFQIEVKFFIRSSES